MTADAHQISVVDIPENCGNAPRKMVIRDFLIALYSRDSDAVIATLRDDIEWHIVGSRILSTAAQVCEWMRAQAPVSELKLHTIITHGTDCGADGTIRFADGSQSHFNHIIVFAGHGKNAKLKELRTYIIDA